jgi:hypothetical protein
MNIEDKIKRWVVLDNQLKQLQNQIQLLKDEKNDLTNNLIEHFDNNNKKYPIINISDGKLTFIQIKQPNALSYKFLEQCFTNYFNNVNANVNANANASNSNNTTSLLDYIKLKRTYSVNKTIKRVYN